jgi:hypothetical protein
MNDCPQTLVACIGVLPTQFSYSSELNAQEFGAWHGSCAPSPSPRAQHSSSTSSSLSLEGGGPVQWHTSREGTASRQPGAATAPAPPSRAAAATSRPEPLAGDEVDGVAAILHCGGGGGPPVSAPKATPATPQAAAHATCGPDAEGLLSPDNAVLTGATRCEGLQFGCAGSSGGRARGGPTSERAAAAAAAAAATARGVSLALPRAAATGMPQTTVVWRERVRGALAVRDARVATWHPVDQSEHTPRSVSFSGWRASWPSVCLPAT